MNQLQKHIADSLKKFEKTFCIEDYAGEPFLDNGHIDSPDENLHKKIQYFLQQSLLQLLEIAKGEVEKKLKDSVPANYNEDDYNAGVQEGLSQALDTLTITNLTKHKKYHKSSK